MGKMKDAAVTYARNGYMVFPLRKGEKIPACAHGVKDATSDVAKVSSWWDEMPDANIGMACGHGIAVVDVDMHNGVDGGKSIADAGFTPPDTLVQLTPSGGRHYVCKGNGIGNATNVNNLHGVDVRGEGGYIVVAPSVVNGTEYEWENWGAELADFPKWAMKAKSVAQPVFVVEHHDGSANIERVKAYLATMDAAVQGAGGHVALLRAAEVVAVRFGVPPAEAKNLLWSEFNPRCVPPWDYTNTKDRRDFERKVDEALKHPQHAFGDLRDAVCPSMMMIQDEIDEGKRIFLGKVKAHGFETDEKRRADILNPPGTVGEIAEWIVKNSPKPVPVFAIAAALSVVATVFARNVTHGMTMTNPSFFLIGPPQSGKSSTMALAKLVIDEIQKRAGCPERKFFMPTRVTSDAAIKAHLEREGRLTMFIDECAGFFAEMKGSVKSGGHLGSVKEAIKNLYSVSPNGDMEATLYAPDHGKMRRPYSCPGACFSFIGGTQPCVFSKVIDENEIMDGFMARMIFLTQTTNPKTNVTALDSRTQLPEHAISVLSDYLRAVAGDISAIPKEGTLPYMDGIKFDIPFSATADVKRMRLIAWQDKVKEDSINDVIVQNLVGRVYENFCRVALTVAAGKYADDLSVAKIDDECVDFASAFISFAYNDLVKYCRDTGDESDYDKFKKRVLTFISARGTVTKGQISQGVRGAKSKKFRDDAISDLIESNEIKYDTGSKMFMIV